MKSIKLLIPMALFSTCLTACVSNLSLSNALLYADKADRMLNSSHIVEIIQRKYIDNKEYCYSFLRYDYNEKYYSNEITYTVTDNFSYKDYSVGTKIQIYEFTYLYQKTQVISGYIELLGSFIKEGYLCNQEVTNSNYNKYFSNTIVGDFVLHPFEMLNNETNEEEYSKYSFFGVETEMVSAKYKESENNISTIIESKYINYILQLYESEIVENGKTHKERMVFDYTIKPIYFHEQYFK